MNSRMMIAINDIRYVQTQIQKILDQDTLVKMQSQSSHIIKKDSQKNMAYDDRKFKSGQNYNRKSMEETRKPYIVEEIEKYKLPKSKSKSKKSKSPKSKSNKIKKDKKDKEHEQQLKQIAVKDEIQKQKYQNPFTLFDLPKKKSTQKMPSLEIIKKQTIAQNKVAVNSKSNDVAEESQTKNIFLQWKRKEQQNNQNKQLNPPTFSPQPQPKALPNQPQSKVFQKSIAPSTIKQDVKKKPIIPLKHEDSLYSISFDDLQSFKTPRVDRHKYHTTTSQLPQYLKHSNPIPLRTSELFLIQKYKYKKVQKGQDLRQKYKLLDEKIDRIKSQFNSHISKQQRKDKTVSDLPGNSRETNLQQMNEKKRILDDYLRYSPLMKLITINKKLKEQSYTINQNRKDKARSVSPYPMKMKM